MTRTRKPAPYSYVKDVTGSPMSGPGDPSRISQNRRNPSRPPVRQGVIIERLDGAVATDDGRDILVTFRRAKGGTSTLVCPAALAQNLISLLLQSLATAQRKQRKATARQVLLAESLRLLPAGTDGRLVAVVRISGGAEMSFLLPANTAKELLAALDPGRRLAAAAAGAAAG